MPRIQHPSRPAPAPWWRRLMPAAAVGPVVADPGSAVPLSGQPAPATGSKSAPPGEDDWRGGCGWFESSHDLATGLAVEAVDASDAPPASLPPALWLWLATHPQPSGSG